MIRKIQSKDREKMLEMMTTFYSSPAVCHNIPQSHMIATINEALNNNPYLDIFVIENEGKIAGYALTAYTYSNEAGGKVVWIEEIYIQDEFRGKGLGNEFFDFVDNYFCDVARIRLEVEKDNIDAIRLYKRRGYEYLAYDQYINQKC